jgi:hypothetical protein
MAFKNPTWFQYPTKYFALKAMKMYRGEKYRFTHSLTPQKIAFLVSFTIRQLYFQERTHTSTG